MANWSILKNAISDAIKANGNQEITGQLLQQVLLNIVTNVGANATFGGVATPATNPGTPDGSVFYLATTNGTYANFSNIIVDDEVAILQWANGIWNKLSTDLAPLNAVLDLEIGPTKSITARANYYIGEIGQKIEMLESTSVLHIVGDIEEGVFYIEISTNISNTTVGTEASYLILTDENDIVVAKSVFVTDGTGNKKMSFRLKVPRTAKKFYARRIYGGQISYTLTKATNKIDVLSEKVTEIDKYVNTLKSVDVDLSIYPSLRYTIVSMVWKYYATRHKYIPVVAGEKYRLTSNADNTSQYCFMSQEETPVNGGAVMYVVGDQTYSIPANDSRIITIPEGCNYLYIRLSISSGADTTPKVEKIGELDYLHSSIESASKVDTINHVKYLLSKGLVTSLYDSKDTLLPNNTFEHFMAIGRFDGQIKKADMRITSDNKVFLSHDASNTNYSWNTNTDYRMCYADGTEIPSNTFVFEEHTLEECLALRYYDKANNIYLKTCDLETFIRICKMYHVVPLLTLRDNKQEEVMQEVLRVLKKYKMENSAIINCYPCSTAKAALVRKYLPNNYIRVLGEEDTSITGTKTLPLSVVKNYSEYGNILVYIWTNQEVYDSGKYTDVIEWCIDNNIAWYANVRSAEHDGSSIVGLSQSQKIPNKKTYYIGINKTGQDLNIVRATSCSWSGHVGVILQTADAELSVDGKEIYLTRVRENSEFDLRDEVFDSYIVYYPSEITCDNAKARVDKANKRFVISSDSVLADGNYVVKIEI